MTIYNVKNHATGEEKKCLRLDTVYNEVKNITGNEKRAQKVAEWAENAAEGEKRSAIGKYTVEVKNTKEEKING